MSDAQLVLQDQPKTTAEELVMASLLELSIVSMKLAASKSMLTRALKGDRAMANRVRQNLSAAETFIRTTAAILQPKPPDDFELTEEDYPA